MKILRFTASWCNPCKQLAKSLESASLGVEIQVVDIDALPEVAEKYNIRSVPTLVLVDEYNKTVSTLIGAKAPKDILDWFSENV